MFLKRVDGKKKKYKFADIRWSPPHNLLLKPGACQWFPDNWFTVDSCGVPWITVAPIRVCPLPLTFFYSTWTAFHWMHKIQCICSLSTYTMIQIPVLDLDIFCRLSLFSGKCFGKKKTWAFCLSSSADSNDLTLKNKIGV